MSAPRMYIKGGTRLNSVTVNGGQGIVQSGLVLYLDANNPASYPGTGTTWTDLSGNGNNVAMSDSVNTTYTRNNGGYFTLANDAYFYNESTSNLPISDSAYTLSAWVQWPGGTWPSTGGILSIGSAFGTNNAVNALRSAGTNIIDNYWWGNDLNTTVTASAPAWFNVVAQWDEYNRYIWVNGQLYGSQPASGLNVTDGTLQVGATWTGAGEGLNGNIGQVLIYNRALTHAEIFTNYVYTRRRYSV